MISIVFSTFNGEQTLATMLDAIIKLDTNNICYELIVIDNNSTDGTSNILTSYQNKMPLKILFEYKKGKNHALNKALKYIKGDIIIFTDDDIIPKKDWLLKIHEVTNLHPSFDIFGGKIIPHWTSQPQPWNTDWISQGIVYAITSDKNHSGKIGAQFIWGPNMIIRRKIFDAGYKFDTNIGPNGTSTYTMGSETSFTLMLEQSGYKCWFEPSIAVKHIIRNNQMSQKWVLARAIRFGKGEAKKNPLTKENCTFFLKAPRYLYKKIFIEYMGLYKIKIQLGSKEIEFKKRWHINFLKGLLLGYRENYL